MNTPIFTSTSYQYLGKDHVPYQRYFNTANQDSVVRKVAALEGAESGVLFGSGMAAISTSFLAFAGAGDGVVLMEGIYGGTQTLATQHLGRLGVNCRFAPPNAESICAAVDETTRVVMIESPTNPLLKVVDIKKIAEFARLSGAVSVIDGTFASPINQHPISLGIDVVVHSGTKYLGGHSDIQCGIALTSAEKTEQIIKVAQSLGGSLNASVCYLLERSLKTLALRVERQSANALALAQYLSGRPEVKQVYYPGLHSSPDHEIAKAQMTAFGGMLSFELSELAPAAEQFIRRLSLITPAVSLGGVETTICAPAVTSHAKISAEERANIGVTDSLLRLSVGIEHIDDLIGDLEQALRSA